MVCMVLRQPRKPLTRSIGVTGNQSPQKNQSLLNRHDYSRAGCTNVSFNLRWWLSAEGGISDLVRIRGHRVHRIHRVVSVPMKARNRAGRDPMESTNEEKDESERRGVETRWMPAGSFDRSGVGLGPQLSSLSSVGAQGAKSSIKGPIRHPLHTN